MNNKIILITAFVIVIGCIPFTPPTSTPAPAELLESESPTPETPEEPVIFDFGGKAVFTQLHFDDLESGELQAGFVVGKQGKANIIENSDQVFAGDYSIQLSRSDDLKTDPDILPLEGGGTYLIDFDYRIINRNSNDSEILYFIFKPVGENANKISHWISTFPMAGVDQHGTFATGGTMGEEPVYQLTIHVANSSSVVLDNIRIIRQDSREIAQQPQHWENLSDLPFPRLGNYSLGMIHWIAVGMLGGPEFYYSANTVEERLAMFDVIAGLTVNNTNIGSGSLYRIRSLNPDILIAPYVLAHERDDFDQPMIPMFNDATFDFEYDYQSGLNDEWFVKTSNGDLVDDPDWSGILKMNISEFCPTVDGFTFNDYLIDWVLHDVMTTGKWDGIFFDNLFGSINPHIPGRWDPGQFDFDFNRNGLRDETIALTSEMTRQASISMLNRLREEVGDLEIIVGNAGPDPEIHLAQYVNGYTFECVNKAWEEWDGNWTIGSSEPDWRLILQAYDIMQSEGYSPKLNILEGCGYTASVDDIERLYLEPNEQDFKKHRFTMGTALLGDGFYEYDLHTNRSTPYWFDEYTVNPQGVAEEAPENKGYLGLALGNAVELKSPSETIWEQDFESETFPAELRSASGVYLGQDPGDVIEGVGNLVLDNPDHSEWGRVITSTNTSQVPFTPGETHVVEFDWRVLESLDNVLFVYIWDGQTDNMDIPKYFIPGVVTGDSGNAIFPMTLGQEGNQRLTFDLFGGGGKVAIDNIKVTRGGAGPWRRDFENGFVLVNPLNKPYTFTLDELSGGLGRTGITRILGTQALEINNGQPVVEPLTLQAFDAIILLADHVPLR